MSTLLDALLCCKLLKLLSLRVGVHIEGVSTLKEGNLLGFLEWVSTLKEGNRPRVGVQYVGFHIVVVSRLTGESIGVLIRANTGRPLG